MNIFAWLFRSKPDARKTTSARKSELAAQPDWKLESIVRNPGEFTVEMRTAAKEILAQRKSLS